MKRELKVIKSINISATSERIWEALTNPEKIKVYLFGTETITDWKIGSPIIFQGEFEGHQYKDKGNVIDNQPLVLLKYNYWSGFSGLADSPENYSIITYSIEPADEGLMKFTWNQEGFSSEEGWQHTETGLPGMLEVIKELAEAQ